MGELMPRLAAGPGGAGVRPHALAWFLAMVWLVTALVGLVILLLVEPPKIPLVGRDSWRTTGAFTQNVRPRLGEISRSILLNPQSVFWRSWTQESGSQPGLVVSAPFAAPTWLAVPFAGYPAEPGIELYLECLVDGRRLPITQGNAHETWVERTLWIGASWCPSTVRLVARSESQRSYVALGTPFRSSLLSWLKESVFIVVLVHALAWALLIAPGLAIVRVWRRRGFPSSLLLAIPVTLFAGYLVFYVSYYGGLPGQASVILFALACLAAVVIRSRDFATDLARDSTSQALRLSVALSLFYAMGLYAADIGAGSFAANYRFSPAIWSTDNQLPQLVAEALYDRRPLAGVLGGGWHVSDRPPLLTGLFLLGRPLWEPLIAIGDNARLRFLFYQGTGIVASTLWVLPLGVLLARALPRARDVALATSLIATMGFVVFNSTYVWPKMLAGALGLWAYLAVLEARQRPSGLALLLYGAAGALSGLAMMAHGGVVFGLAILVMGAMWPLQLLHLGRLAVLATTALAIMLPWALWQRFEDPPGTALVKFAFAGTWGMGEEAKGVLPTILDAYRQLTPGQWVLSRWHGLLTLLGAERPPHIDSLWARPMDAAGRARLSDFAFVFPSLRIAGLGFVVLAGWALIRASRRGVIPPGGIMAARWVGAGLGGIALNWIATWNMHILHHQSYFSLLLVAAGLFVTILLAPQWVRWLAISTQFAYFALVWVWSPLMAPGTRLDVLAGWLLAGLGFVFIAAATSHTSSPELPVVTPKAATASRPASPKLPARARRRT
jgi:hypothetical protein